MTGSSIRDCLTWNEPKCGDESAHAARVIPTNENRYPVGVPDIHLPVDLVDESRQPAGRRLSASVDDYYLNFVLPSNSSNARTQSRTEIVTTLTRILYQQIQRLRNEIERSLTAIRPDDDEMSDEIEQRLALLIYILGEPGLYGAKRVLDSHLASDGDTDTVLKLIAKSATPGSLSDVVKVISEYLAADDARIRYSATEALARLPSKEATGILRRALKDESNASVKRLMEAAIRDR
jgi:hypothetical protein